MDVAKLFRIMLEEATGTNIKFIDTNEEENDDGEREANHWDNVGKYGYYEKKYEEDN